MSSCGLVAWTHRCPIVQRHTSGGLMVLPGSTRRMLLLSLQKALSPSGDNNAFPECTRLVHATAAVWSTCGAEVHQRVGLGRLYQIALRSPPTYSTSRRGRITRSR